MVIKFEEQETTVNFNDGRAMIYTSNSAMMAGFDKLSEAEDTEWKLEGISKLKNGEIAGKQYSCPENAISFSVLTEEERAEKIEQLRKNNMLNQKKK